MVKRLYSEKLISAYSFPEKKRSFLYSLAIIVILIVLIVYGFFGSKEKTRPSVSGTANFQEVENDLASNLAFLNETVVKIDQEQPQPLKQIQAIHGLKSKQEILDPKRLSASALVYSEPQRNHASSDVDQVEAALGDRRLVGGEVLHAVLESAIQSDFSGPVRAILSEPVYSYNAMRLLLPVGTRIIGQYQNGVSATQVRVGIRWERMVLPDGSSVVFDAPGMDPMGRIGIEASSIHTHFWKRFGDAGLYSVLSSGTQLSGGVDESTLTAGQLLRSQVSESFANTAMSDLEKNKSISPTIYLDPGSEISIFVRRDIVF